MGTRSTSPASYAKFESSDSPKADCKDTQVDPDGQPAQSSSASSGEQTHAPEAQPVPLPPPVHEETANLMIDYAKHGRFDLLYPLLDQHPGSADVRPPYREYGLIHQAAFHGSEVDCKKLLEVYGANPRAKTKYGKLPSKVAKVQGYPELVAILRTYEDRAAEGSDGPAPEPVSLEIDEETANEMINFAKSSRWDHVYDILDDYKGAVDARPPYRDYGLLHQAAWHGCKEQCKKLLDQYGADPKAKSKHGQLPSEVAQQQGYAKLFGILRTYEDRDTALFEEAVNLAKSASWERLFALLDEHKHLINFRPPHTPCNILHEAASQGDVPTCKRLVDDYGANPWLLSKSGQRASQVAEEKGFEELFTAFRVYEEKSLGEAITVHVMQLSGEVLLGDVQLSLHDTVGHLRQLANGAFLKREEGLDGAAVAALVTASGQAPLAERWTIQEAGLLDGTSVTAVTQPDELLLIEQLFHGLIMFRLKVTEKEELETRGFTFPSLKTVLEKDGVSGRGYWPVPGMCGGFSAQILKEESPEPQWRLTCESRSRVVEGSGMRHEITAKGGVKLLADGLL